MFFGLDVAFISSYPHSHLLFLASKFNTHSSYKFCFVSLLMIPRASDESSTPVYVQSRFIQIIQDEQGWCVYLQKHEILRDTVDQHKQSTNTQTDRMHRPYVSKENALI